MSKQDYGTPPEFIAAVERKFGKIAFDLAASPENAVCANYYTKEQDSLKQSWEMPGLLWCNPPFADIKPWVKKASESGSNILMLLPASIATEWFADHVYKEATLVIAIRPRITFVGCEDPYKKDCMLLHYGKNWGISKLEIWRWK